MVRPAVIRFDGHSGNSRDPQSAAHRSLLELIGSPGHLLTKLHTAIPRQRGLSPEKREALFLAVKKQGRSSKWPRSPPGRCRAVTAFVEENRRHRVVEDAA